MLHSPRSLPPISAREMLELVATSLLATNKCTVWTGRASHVSRFAGAYEFMHPSPVCLYKRFYCAMNPIPPPPPTPPQNPTLPHCRLPRSIGCTVADPIPGYPIKILACSTRSPSLAACKGSSIAFKQFCPMHEGPARLLQCSAYVLRIQSSGSTLQGQILDGGLMLCHAQICQDQWFATLEMAPKGRLPGVQHEGKHTEASLPPLMKC